MRLLKKEILAQDEREIAEENTGGKSTPPAVPLINVEHQENHIIKKDSFITKKSQDFK